MNSDYGSAASVDLTIDSSGVIPLPGRKPDVMPALRGVARHVEVPERRHDLEHVARLDRVIRPVGEDASDVTLHGDAQRAFLHGRADRVGAPHILSADAGAQRQVLAGLEPEQRLQVLGNGEGDGDGVARLAVDPRDGETVESAHAEVSWPCGDQKGLK